MSQSIAGGTLTSNNNNNVDILAKERDEKFKKWLLNKSIKEKAFECLGRLDPSRALKDETLIEVGISLCAIDRILGVEENTNKPPLSNPKPSDSTANAEETMLTNLKDIKKAKNNDSSNKKTLKASWMKWTMELHTFNSVIFTPTELTQLTEGAKEFMTSEYEMLTYSDESQETKDKASRIKNILPSLKYFFQQVPKAGEKPRPLTNDQKIQNTVYMRELRKLWKQAREELDNRVVEFIAKGLKTYQQQQERISKESTDKERSSKESSEKEKHSKRMADNGQPLTARSDPFSDSTTPRDAKNQAEKVKLMKQLESQCLNELSLKRLRQWIEEDEDKKLVEENEAALVKLKEAKESHEQFVKKKDSLRIRLPESLPNNSSQGMSYGRDLSGIRATTKGPQTTVELMAGSGLKYVHATNKGRNGGEGDLEKSRKLLLKMGHVYKDNFDTEQFGDYIREKNDNAYNTEKAKIDLKAKEDSSKAYEEWLQQKEMKDQAIKCLSLMAKPTIPEVNSDMIVQGAGNNTTTTGNRRSLTSGMSELSLTTTMNKALKPGLNFKLQDHRMIFDHMIEIGKNLKKVDRSLFAEWSKWAENILPVNTAGILWDFFPPIACDVHSTAYSQVRDSFIKLLRPGVDYKETFVNYVDKMYFQKKIEKFKDDKEYRYVSEDIRRDLDEELEGLKKEWMQNISLPKENFVNLLKQLGIVLKETEMRSLIDAFDANGDGVITLTEFLDFCGPKRDRRSGNTLLMQQKCCWMTTCKITGMPNGYSVSNPTKRALRDNTMMMNESMNKSRDESKHSDTYDDSPTGNNNNNSTGKVVIRELANGEKRMYVELSERKRREELLRKLNLLNNGSDNNEEFSKKKKDAEELYEDDYEEDPDQQSSKVLKSKTTKGGKQVIDSCQYSTWSMKERKDGLKYLTSITSDARAEETLKNLLSNKILPNKPNFWAITTKAPIARGNYPTKSSNKSSKRRNSRRSEGKGNDSDYSDYSDFDEGKEDSDFDPMTEILLSWGPSQSNELISFYSIEFGGPITTIGMSNGDGKWVNLYTDPPDADMDQTFSFGCKKSGLLPGISYRFRIRAFNGFGPGDYTYKVFTTLSSSPLTPRAIKVAPDSVTLRWTFTPEFFRRMEELKKIFFLADKDRSKKVSRSELSDMLVSKEEDFQELKIFLEKICKSRGVDLNQQGYDGLFDMIECDDDNVLSWEEFEAFFLSAGWSSVPLGTTTNPSATGSVISSKSQSQTTKRTTGDTTYVIEKCESEFEQTYKEVLRTTLGQATISRLEPGKSYRFRVFALNAEDIPGPPSEPVIVHTLVETPLAPTPLINSITSKSVILSWKPRNAVTNTRDKAFVNKMLGDWAHNHSEQEAGVSIDAVFSKYDRNQSGDIDSEELSLVLEDLGVDVTPDRLEQAFSILDANGDGVISYEEFAKWWRRDEVTFVIKRSEEIVPLSRAAFDNTNNPITSQETLRAVSRGRKPSMSAIPEDGSINGSTTGRSVSRTRPLSASGVGIAATTAVATTALTQPIRQVAVPIVVYRDDKPKCEVLGLIPNSMYHFKLRYIGSRSNSMLSPPLVLMSAPMAPTNPSLIDVSANSVRVKWYPGKYGAYKFVVHLRQVINPNTSGSGRRQAAPIVGIDTKDDGWFNVYNGPDNCYTCTTLSSECSYELRVFSANYQGNLSESSPILLFNTLPRNDNTTLLTPRNVSSTFTVECTGDICVGDIILITERLFLKPKNSKDINSMRPKPKTTTKDQELDMSRSVTSINSTDISITAAPGSFIGERTIAAYVVRDNYRSTRDILSQKKIGPENPRDFGSYRKVWLEVIWQKGSTEECRKYEVKPGEILERMQNHLEQFEVFRCAWKNETSRYSLKQEWDCLQDCFISYN